MDQYSEDQVVTYDVAREFLGRRLGAALGRARCAVDAVERERHRDEAGRLEAARQRLRIGSDEVERILAQGRQDRGAAAD